MKRRHLRRRLLQPLATGLLFCVFVGMRFLPWTATRWLGWLSGSMASLFPRGRRVALANLALAFPDWDAARRRRVMRQAFRHTASTFVETVWVLWRPERITQLVHFEEGACEAFSRHADHRQGAILLSPHLGNWEFANLAMNEAGYPISAVAADILNPFAAWLMQRLRSQFGGQVIPQKGAARGIFKALREARYVGLLVDQNTRPRQGGVFVEFFGLPVPVSRAPAMFGRHAQVPIFVVQCRRTPRRRFVLEIRPLPKPIGDYDDDIAIMQDITRLTEALVRERPEQYLWSYHRWRYIPSDWDTSREPAYPFYAKRSEAPLRQAAGDA
jgi:Kdo2-lipid IVA lauroyltransferase/acyltransferase